MEQAVTAVSRIEFRTDLMREDSPVIPLGFLVECQWDDSRWLGLVYRPQLTPNELRAVNLATWPEMANPEELLRGMFDQAWSSEEGQGGAAIAARFSVLSALNVDQEDGAAFAKTVDLIGTDDEIDGRLCAALRAYEPRLKPSCDAKVFQFDAERAFLAKISHREAA